jgi:hypothetical protein
MNYIRHVMTSEQLRVSLVEWDNQDKIILMDNEFVHYLGEAVSGLILETESLKQRHYIDVNHIEVHGISDLQGNWVGYYVPDDNGIYHLIRSIMNVTSELLNDLERVNAPEVPNSPGHFKGKLVRGESGCWSAIRDNDHATEILTHIDTQTRD